MAKGKGADLVEQVRQLRLQAEEFEKSVRLARGTERDLKPGRIVAHPARGPHYVGDEGPTEELMVAVQALLTEHPMRFGATGGADLPPHFLAALARRRTLARRSRTASLGMNHSALPVPSGATSTTRTPSRCNRMMTPLMRLSRAPVASSNSTKSARQRCTRSRRTASSCFCCN